MENEVLDNINPDDIDVNKWLEEQPNRRILIQNGDKIEEIPFNKLRKGDKFIVIEDNYLLEHENGKKEFIALSDPQSFYGILTIDVETC